MTTSELNLDSDSVIKYEYEFNPGFLERCLYHSAGTDLQLMKHCPNYDRVKMQGIGGTVLATALLAFISGSYALYVVFGPTDINGKDVPLSYEWALASCLFGVVWSMVIYNLDRFIVSSTGHGDGTEKTTRNEWLHALPRILMACLIGVVIAKPLEIRIMKQEIDSVLDERRIKQQNFFMDIDKQNLKNKISEIDQVKADLSKQLNAKKEEISKKEQARNTAEFNYNQELSGSGGSITRGDGKIAKANLELLNVRKADLEREKARLEPDIKDLENRIKQEDIQIQEAYKEFDGNKATWEKKGNRVDGLIERIEIAHEKSLLASLCITAMLILIEVAPLIFKMMLSLSPIDYITENQKRLSLVRRGIWTEDRLSSGGYLETSSEFKSSYDEKEIIKVGHARYYEAELQVTEVIGKLKLDRETTEKIHGEAKVLTFESIEKDPSKYFQQPNS